MTKSYAQPPSLRQTTIVEKFGFITTLAVLLGRGHIPSIDAAAAIPDAVVGLLFVVAFAATSSKARSIVTWQRSTSRGLRASAPEGLTTRRWKLFKREAGSRLTPVE